MLDTCPALVDGGPASVVFEDEGRGEERGVPLRRGKTVSTSQKTPR